MYYTGHMELSSASILQRHTADRPSFHATICGTFSGAKQFQVFCMPRGLLCVELRKGAVYNAEAERKAMVAGALLGGMIGAGIGAMIAGAAATPGHGENLDAYGEDELFELARTRKRSFVSKADDIRTISVEAPGWWDANFGQRSLAGYVKLRDNTLGKVLMEVHDQAALSVAVDALPRRFGARASVNVELDPRTRKFVRRRS